MIGSVEHFHAELNRPIFGDPEILEDMRSECFPTIQEKLFTPWNTLSSIVKGLLVSLPKLDRLLLS